MDRVRVGTLYVYGPATAIDHLCPPFNVSPGDIVKVINLPGCPKANTMCMCHVAKYENGKWIFSGMVSVFSLEPIRKFGLTEKQCSG